MCRLKAVIRVVLFIIVAMTVFFAGKGKTAISHAKNNCNLQNAWQNNDLTTDEWPGYSYFLNANEWHYNLTYESTVAMAVKDYARKSGMENEGFRLKRIYEIEGIWYGFVESEKGSELYLIIRDYPDNSYIVAADVRKNKRAEMSLGESYSYNSALKWYPYDIYKKYDVSASVSEVNNGYDSIYANCGYTALLAYLELNGIAESSWELDGNYMYIGTSGYIAYICFTNDEQRVDLLIDVNNKTFAVLKGIYETSRRFST